LTILQSLRAATSNVAAWMRAEADFGSVEQGKRADLALLDANPLDDIGNVRRIAAVVRGGEVLDRAALDALLQSARSPRFVPPTRR
jgi:imidazolonepropionase-like amidohydrolase